MADYSNDEAVLDSWTIPSLLLGGVEANVLKNAFKTYNRVKNINELIDKRKEWGIAFRKASGDPAKAIETLRQQEKGFVPNATKDGIDFVWGEYTPPKKPNQKGGGYGLAHIRERRNADKGNGEEFLDNLADLILNGKKYLKKEHPGRYYIGTDKDEAVIRTDYSGKLWKWLNSAYPKD